jgi:hypothetical protein
MKIFIRTVLFLIIVFSLFPGCIKTPKIPNKPPTIQWGDAGTQPTAVWPDYKWEIRAVD